MEERNYYLLFSLFSGIGPKRFSDLISFFGSAKNAWKGTSSDFEKLKIPQNIIKSFEEFRKTANLESHLKKLKEKDVKFVCLIDKFYPQKLLKIKDPPIVLFYKGGLTCLNNRTIGVVGTRKMTSYGKLITEKLVSELVSYGFTIVSGLALGVDSVSHKTALDFKGKTAAVLGCGVNCCLPRENENLYREIIKNGGAIISQFQLDEPPTKGTFPARNRIIAGLSDAVLVTEAGEESGALITAQHASYFGIPVFSVPGPITSKQSYGTSILLKKGAKLVSQISDILEEFEIKNKAKNSNLNFKDMSFSSQEKKILTALQNERYSIDDLSRKIKIPINKLSIALTSLEMQGVIKNYEGFFEIA